MLDFVVVNNRWKSSVTMCRTFRKPDVVSDHNLVMAGIRVKLKTIHREKSGKKFDIERLDDNLVRREYSTLLKSYGNRQRRRIGTVSNRPGKTSDPYTQRWHNRYWEPRKEGRGSQEVLRMSDQRRAMKTTKTQSEESRKGYNKLT